MADLGGKMIGDELVLLGAVGVGKKSTKVVQFRDRSDPAKMSELPSDEDVYGSVVKIIADGIYSVSALMRFQCTDGPNTISNWWSITRNSQNGETMIPRFVLASALLPEPPERERQRDPWVTLSWAGILHKEDQLRVECERENPRLYQGTAYDRFCFLRVIQLSKPD